MKKIDEQVILSLCSNNMSVSAVARELHYHRNTVMYHIKQIEKETGLNPQRFYDLVDLVEMVKEGK